MLIKLIMLNEDVKDFCQKMQRSTQYLDKVI